MRIIVFSSLALALTAHNGENKQKIMVIFLTKEIMKDTPIGCNFLGLTTNILNVRPLRMVIVGASFKYFEASGWN